MSDQSCRVYIHEVEGGYLVSKWTPHAYRDVKVAWLGSALRIAALHLKYCERFNQLREEKMQKFPNGKSMTVTMESDGSYKVQTYDKYSDLVNTKHRTSLDNALEEGRAFMNEQEWVDVTDECEPHEGEIGGFPAIWYTHHGGAILPGPYKVKHGRIYKRKA
jgi:hypothetical protein